MERIPLYSVVRVTAATFHGHLGWVIMQKGSGFHTVRLPHVPEPTAVDYVCSELVAVEPADLTASDLSGLLRALMVERPAAAFALWSELDSRLRQGQVLPAEWRPTTGEEELHANARPANHFGQAIVVPLAVALVAIGADRPVCPSCEYVALSPGDLAEHQYQCLEKVGHPATLPAPPPPPAPPVRRRILTNTELRRKGT